MQLQQQLPRLQQPGAATHSALRRVQPQRAAARQPQPARRRVQLLAAAGGSDEAPQPPHPQQPPQQYEPEGLSSSSSGQQQGRAPRGSPEWQQQQAAKQRQRYASRLASQQPRRPSQRQQQEVAGAGAAGLSADAPYPYDNTRWKVQQPGWGPPPRQEAQQQQPGARQQQQQQQRGPQAAVRAPVDYLVIGPNNAPHRAAAYAIGRLLNAERGAIMLLCHGHHGASKALAVLHTASARLQRKHGASLVCQVGPAEGDPFKLKVLARLWPYAGTWQPQPQKSTAAAAAAAAAAQGGAGTGSSADQQQQQQQQLPAQGQGPADNSSSSSIRGPSFLRRGLVGALPDPASLPRCIRHRPALAVPAAVSRHCSFNASRLTEPRALAASLAAALQRKGRARVRAAGGLAALHALQAVRLADVALARAHGQGVVMHVELVSTDEQPQQQQQQDSSDASGAPAQRMSHYSLTLLAAHRDRDATPATCVFPVQRMWRLQQEEEEGQEEDDGGWQQEQAEEQEQQQQQEEEPGVWDDPPLGASPRADSAG